MRLRLLGISLALVLCCLSAGGASAAASVSALYQAVPPPPADVVTAAAWVREGAVAEPQLMHLQAQLKAERARWLAGRFSGLRKRVSNPEDLNEIRTQELAAYRALFSDWQNSRRSVVARTESDLAPSPIRAPSRRPSNARPCRSTERPRPAKSKYCLD